MCGGAWLGDGGAMLSSSFEHWGVLLLWGLAVELLLISFVICITVRGKGG